VQAGESREKLLSTLPAAAVHGNRLIARLAGADRKRIVGKCEVVELDAGQVLMRPGQRTTHAWFPLDSTISLGMVAPGKRNCFEVALIGPEGMVGVPLLLGAAASSLRATVVKPGTALRLRAPELRLQLEAAPGFRQRMHHYVFVSLTQLAQAALCTHYHHVDERLARWLLMTQDRAPHGAVHATHEFLAATLGVRRAGVTRAAASLQRRQLIAYHRGVLTVLDRDGLEAAACACYAADCASYASVMRPRTA
jgi:CRP-like cAMP-binding protein